MPKVKKGQKCTWYDVRGPELNGVFCLQVRDIQRLIASGHTLRRTHQPDITRRWKGGKNEK